MSTIYECSCIKFISFSNSCTQTILLCFKLSLRLLRGQAYDGASNMLGRKSGVAKLIKDVQKKALHSHCLGHSTSLAVKSIDDVTRGMRDCMDACMEIVKLIKFSPKRETMLETLKMRDLIMAESHEDLEDNTEIDTPLKIKKFSHARWTMRHVGFTRIKENYQALLKLWEEIWDHERSGLDSQTKARIVGASTKMKTFDFLFYLELAIVVHSQTDALSQTLQDKTMTLLEGKTLAKGTMQCLRDVRNENMFNLFYAKVLKRQHQLCISDPKLPRRTRNMRDYCQMQRNVQVDGLESASQPFQHDNVSEHYKHQHCECIDTLVANLDDRFQQDTIEILSGVEEFFIHCLKSPNAVNEEVYDDFLSSAGMVHFQEDVDLLKLKHEFVQLHFRFNNHASMNNFHDIIKFFEIVVSSDYNHKLFMPNIIDLLKLVMIHPATTASCERSFRLSKLIKSDVRSTMTHERFNHLCLIKHYKHLLSEVPVESLMQEFVSVNDRRKKHFGRVTRDKMKAII